jgi:hypothetical protein
VPWSWSHILLQSPPRRRREWARTWTQDGISSQWTAPLLLYLCNRTCALTENCALNCFHFYTSFHVRHAKYALWGGCNGSLLTLANFNKLGTEVCIKVTRKVWFLFVTVHNQWIISCSNQHLIIYIHRWLPLQQHICIYNTYTERSDRNKPSYLCLHCEEKGKTMSVFQWLNYWSTMPWRHMYGQGEVKLIHSWPQHKI